MPNRNKNIANIPGPDSLALPPALQQLFAMPMHAPAPAQSGQLPSYYSGGMIGEDEEELGGAGGAASSMNIQGGGRATRATRKNRPVNDDGTISPMPPPRAPTPAEPTPPYTQPGSGEPISPVYPGAGGAVTGGSTGLSPGPGGLNAPWSEMPGVGTGYIRAGQPANTFSGLSIPDQMRQIGQQFGIGDGPRGVTYSPEGEATMQEQIAGIPANQPQAYNANGRRESLMGTSPTTSGAGFTVATLDPRSMVLNNDASVNPGMTKMMDHAAADYRQRAGVTERAMGGPLQPGQMSTVAEIEPEVVETAQGSQLITEPSVIQPGQPAYVHPGPMGQQMAAGLGANAGSGKPMDPQMLEMQINQFVSQHPEQVQQIQEAIKEALNSGELTTPELNTVVQLATVAAQNPQMYPHIRQYAIQQGIAGEEDLPQEYDQGLVIILLVAAKAVQGMGGGGDAQTGAPIASMKAGGPIPGGSGESKPIVVEAHQGEYVIPKHVVEMKGKEFFDSLVEKYRDRQ